MQLSKFCTGLPARNKLKYFNHWLFRSISHQLTLPWDRSQDVARLPWRPMLYRTITLQHFLLLWRKGQSTRQCCKFTTVWWQGGVHGNPASSQHLVVKFWCLVKYDASTETLFWYLVKQAKSQGFAIFFACTCRRWIRNDFLFKSRQGTWREKYQNRSIKLIIT